jgi:hypothetical protein
MNCGDATTFASNKRDKAKGEEGKEDGTVMMMMMMMEARAECWGDGQGAKGEMKSDEGETDRAG